MSALQFLLLEPNLADSQAVQATLITGSIDCKLLRVDSCNCFVKALETNTFDLILSDYALPDLDGVSALKIAQKIQPETPFVFVSASVGEELAIAALTAGAAGFVLKHRLETLVTCVQRVLRTAQERRELQLKASLSDRNVIAHYHKLFESIDEGFCICEMLFDEHGKPENYRFLQVNSVFEQLTGLQQPTGKTARELVPNLEAHWFETYGKVVQTGEPCRFEQQSLAMNRWLCWISCFS